MISMLILSSFGCKKENARPSIFVAADYYGQKSVSYPGVSSGQNDTIYLNFLDTTYSYTSTSALDYGHGKYLIKGDSLQLIDQEVRVTLYSWDWILSGTYKYTCDKGRLTLTGKYFNTNTACSLVMMEN